MTARLNRWSAPTAPGFMSDWETETQDHSVLTGLRRCRLPEASLEEYRSCRLQTWFLSIFRETDRSCWWWMEEARRREDRFGAFPCWEVRRAGSAMPSAKLRRGL